LAEASTLLNLADGEIVVNVQGDEPLIDSQLVQAVADLLTQHEDASMGTAAHAIAHIEDFINPNVVKVVLNAANKALYFSRAPIAWWRDGFSDGICTLPDPAPLRHIGIYAYRVGFLRRFPQLTQAPIETTEALEQLRAMWHGYRIAVHVSAHAPGPGVDTPEDLERARALFALEANRADD
jgi:3-deoxy-manno-octulosonate cytidylyltransferase (CMP-KDO synthetase)